MCFVSTYELDEQEQANSRNRKLYYTNYLYIYVDILNHSCRHEASIIRTAIHGSRNITNKHSNLKKETLTVMCIHGSNIVR